MRDKRWIWFGLLAGLVLMCSTLCLADPTESGEHPGTGMSVSIQGKQLDIMLPIWFSQRGVITPMFNVARASDGVTDFAIGLGVRSNFSSDKVVPFAGARVKMFGLNTNSDSYFDFVVGPILGAECFMDEAFSISV